MRSRPYTILVTGVGAIIGYGIIKSLRHTHYQVTIVGMDIYPDAVGQHWCNHFEQAVRADGADYVPFICSLVARHKIDLVIPGIEQDVRRLSREMSELKSLPTRFALNTPELISLCEDKWLTHLKLIDAGFPYIKSHIDGSFEAVTRDIGLPMLLKPRRSYASKGIFQIHSQEDYNYWRRKLGDNFMVQEIVGGDEEEFTAAVFGYGDGQCSKGIIFRRVLSGEGATAKAVVVSDVALMSRITELVRFLKPVGPTNFQFRRHRGEYLLLEINPRISSSTSLRTAFGFNEAQMCIEYYLLDQRPSIDAIKKGRATRYIEDYIVYDSDHI